MQKKNNEPWQNKKKLHKKEHFDELRKKGMLRVMVEVVSKKECENLAWVERERNQWRERTEFANKRIVFHRGP